MNVAIHTRYALSICAGVGTFDLGLRIAFQDVVTAVYVEREVSAAEVLVSRMAEGSLHPAPVHANLFAFDGRPWRGVIHIIAAGLPCQPYSVAGKQLGHEDERAIWPDFIRVVGEVQPDLVFLENVPQFLRYFRPVGEELSKLGYCVEEPLLITAGAVGASHRRQRFFAMAYREGGGLRILRESSERDGLSDRGDTAMADAARDERAGSGWSAGSGRRVRQAGDELADTGNGLVQKPGRGSEGRDGPRPAEPVLVNANSDGRRGEFEPGGSECGRTGLKGDDQGLGHSDEPGLEGRDQRGGELPDERAAWEAGDTRLADTECAERRPHLECDEQAGERFETSDRPRSAGIDLGGSRLPIFAPGPGAAAEWQDLLVRYPWVRPAISQEEVEQLIHSLPDGIAATLAGSRTDQLRACGNAIVAVQCAAALTILTRRAGLI